MAENAQLKLAALRAVVSEAARLRERVRLALSNQGAPDRPQRVVEGVVVEVADSRDGRPRVRVQIATGAGEPVEVRVLLDSIERVESTSGDVLFDMCATDAARRPPSKPTLAFGAQPGGARPTPTRGLAEQSSGERGTTERRPSDRVTNEARPSEVRPSGKSGNSGKHSVVPSDESWDDAAPGARRR